MNEALLISFKSILYIFERFEAVSICIFAYQIYFAYLASCTLSSCKNEEIYSKVIWFKWNEENERKWKSFFFLLFYESLKIKGSNIQITFGHWNLILKWSRSSVVSQGFEFDIITLKKMYGHLNLGNILLSANLFMIFRVWLCFLNKKWVTLVISWWYENNKIRV